MKTFSIFALVASLLAVSPMMAQTRINEASLTPSAIVATMKDKPTGERQSYASIVIAAISSMPISDEEKVAKFISASRAMIAGSKDGNTIGVIATIFNQIPVQYLPAVSKMLAGNFDQKLNGFDDATMTKYMTKIVARSAAYIEVSGCDSPAVRAGILASTFIEAATNKDAAKATIASILPDSLKDAAMAYADDVLNEKVDPIAVAAGIEPESIVETPAVDPDADDIVEVKPKKDATTETPTADTTKSTEDVTTSSEDVTPTTEKVQAVVTEDEDEVPAAKVPLLSRFTKDVSGVLSDTMQSTLYSWEELDLNTLVEDPVAASLLGLGSPVVIPGDATTGSSGLIIEDPESPLYDGQR